MNDFKSYMDDYNSYKRYTNRNCKCRCEAHCGNSCQDCEYCPDCECNLCQQNRENN